MQIKWLHILAVYALIHELPYCMDFCATTLSCCWLHAIRWVYPSDARIGEFIRGTTVFFQRHFIKYTRQQLAHSLTGSLYQLHGSVLAISSITSLWVIIFIHSGQESPMMESTFCVCWLSMNLHGCSVKCLYKPLSPSMVGSLQIDPSFASAVIYSAIWFISSITSLWVIILSVWVKDCQQRNRCFVCAAYQCVCTTALSSACIIPMHRSFEASRSTLVHRACLLGHVATFIIAADCHRLLFSLFNNQQSW